MAGASRAPRPCRRRARPRGPAARAARRRRAPRRCAWCGRSPSARISMWMSGLPGGISCEALASAISPSLQPTTISASEAATSVVGDARVAAEQAGRERMRAGDRALAGHRVRDRNADTPPRARAAPSYASEIWMPPPTSSSGRSALAMSAAARVELCRIGPRAARLRLERAWVDPEIGSHRNRARRAQTSSGTSMTTGPGRPLVATAKARRTCSGMRLVTSTRITSFTAGLQHFDLPRLLRHVLPGMLAVGVADDRDLRNAGVEALDQPGDEIGRAGPERRVAHAGPVGDACA